MHQPFCSVQSLKDYCCIFFSTVSSSINALVAVTMEDFILPVFKNLTEKQVSWLNMGLSKLYKTCFNSSCLDERLSLKPLHMSLINIWKSEQKTPHFSIILEFYSVIQIVNTTVVTIEYDSYSLSCYS